MPPKFLPEVPGCTPASQLVTRGDLAYARGDLACDGYNSPVGQVSRAMTLFLPLRNKQALY